MASKPNQQSRGSAIQNQAHAQKVPSKSLKSGGSSQNALKAGIYTNRLQPGEDPKALEACLEGYIRDFEITTTTGFQLAQELAQVVLKLNRIEQWQIALMQAHMAKYQTRSEFVMALNLKTDSVDELPEWYFNDCQDSRQKARQIYEVFVEILFLIENLSDALLQNIQTELPHLWGYMMKGVGDANGPGCGQSQDQGQAVSTLSSFLQAYSKQSETALALKDFQEQFELEHYFDIAWAQEEDRCEALINGLRAQIQMDLFCDPKMQRGEAMLHRKKTDLLSQLMQLKREAQYRNAIELENSSQVSHAVAT